MKSNKILSITVALLLLGSALAVPSVLASPTVTRFISEVTELGDPSTMPDVTGTTFKVALVIEDVENLYGFDFQFKWDTEYIRYVTHTVCVPVEDYPAPNPPSPYEGTLHKPFLEVKNVVNETHPIPDAEPGTMAWLAYASMDPAPPQSGNTTVAVFTFVVFDQPWDYENPVDVWINFTASSLADVSANAIPHEPINLQIRLWQRKFTYPPLPKLDVNPDLVKDIPLDATFTINVDIMNENDGPLSPFWDVAGFDIVMHFDPTLINAVDITIDPTGTFASFWPGGIFTIIAEYNNTIGEVKVAFLGIPGETGVHEPPYGIFTLFTVTFKSIFESETYPPPECVLGLRNPDPRPMPDPSLWGVEYFMTDMAGFPHPDYSMPPWNGIDTAPPLPHVIENATYRAKFKPPGRWIDLITQYPEGFNGRGPGEPSDVFGPQATVRLIAEVTYNFNPVQQKMVTFEIIHGEFHWILCNITDENGIAWVEFGLPWPCDDPEGRVFGEWWAQATVEIREVVVNDTITWQVGYLIDIISVEPQPDDVFAIGDHLSFKVTVNSISHQDREAYLSIVVYDDLQVPIAWFLVGPITVHYGVNDPVVLECETVPKHTFVGVGKVYANVLYKVNNYYVQYSPQDMIEIGLTI